jgi:hypothetical protein
MWNLSIAILRKLFFCSPLNLHNRMSKLFSEGELSIIFTASSYLIEVLPRLTFCKAWQCAASAVHVLELILVQPDKFKQDKLGHRSTRKANVLSVIGHQLKNTSLKFLQLVAKHSIALSARFFMPHTFKEVKFGAAVAISITDGVVMFALQLDTWSVCSNGHVFLQFNIRLVVLLLLWLFVGLSLFRGSCSLPVVSLLTVVGAPFRVGILLLLGVSLLINCCELPTRAEIPTHEINLQPQIFTYRNW